MIQQRPRDYDPHALERMPDEPPHDLDNKAIGRWVLPESAVDWLQRLARPGPAGDDKPIRRAFLRSQGDYYAYLNQGGGEHLGWRGLSGLFDLKIDPNRYGLYNRAQELYPQAYKSINTAFWRSMSDEERQEIMCRQAAAQERVGFERSTEKFFIGDVQVEGLLGPGEEPPPTEQLTAVDTEYTLRRKAYHQRMRENEEIRLGKRKRRSENTATRDDADCQVLGLPSVVEGIANTPALKSMLPGAKALSAQLAKEIAQQAALDKPAADSPGLRRLRNGKKRPTSFRDLPSKPNSAAAGNMIATGSEAAEAASPVQSETGKRAINRGRKFQRQAAQINTRNKYGLKSRSEMNYPQAFAPVASEMWTGLTDEERTRVYITQAIAQEKAGFEKGAPKFFIEDFDPGQERAPNLREEIGSAPAALYSPASATNWTGGIMLALSAIALVCCWLVGCLSLGVIIGLTCTALIGGVMLGLRGELNQ